ncbi:nuclear transport factor 2 family protein [Nocardia sp. XZ_19_385]|uniref:nuclear transport factor 2 family protein n=1 Tax=Nocardia sp. XZ_19_385 TaxID=2769488 RepID=UPI0018903927|nr:nuclear transport factor 2 family protein [Nocardia sp. XZ_19_385]
MDTADLDTVAQLYRAFAERDIPAILGRFDPDIVINQCSQLPWGGTHRGRDAAVDFFTTLLTHVDSSVEPQRMFSAGDAVIQVGRTTGKTVASGAAFEVDEVHVWRLRDNRVVAFDIYVDTPAMLTALESDR